MSPNSPAAGPGPAGSVRSGCRGPPIASTAFSTRSSNLIELGRYAGILRQRPGVLGDDVDASPSGPPSMVSVASSNSCTSASRSGARSSWEYCWAGDQRRDPPPPPRSRPQRLASTAYASQRSTPPSGPAPTRRSTPPPSRRRARRRASTGRRSQLSATACPYSQSASSSSASERPAGEPWPAAGPPARRSSCSHGRRRRSGPESQPATRPGVSPRVAPAARAARRPPAPPPRPGC